MTGNTARILVWDWAIRLIHWLMVILVPLLWWTAEEGHMEWHKSFGLTMFGLVLFRLLWGLIGTWTARFVPMVQRIGSLPSYLAELRAQGYHPTFGHSPLAVLSVFALLLALTIQITTGLFSVDVDGLESGPLSIMVSFETGRQFAEIHEFNFNLLAALIGLHIAAIAIYRFVVKEKLVGPMLSGRRPSKDFAGEQLPENRMRPIRMIAATIIALACTLTVANFG